MAHIEVHYAGTTYTVPSTSANREELQQLGQYAHDGRGEVLTLLSEEEGFALTLVVGPAIPVAVMYVD